MLLKSDYIIAFVLMIVTLGICALKIIYGWQNWSDDSAYIAQSIALANGEVAQYIADNTLMMTKSDWLIGPYAYPWGYPMLLAIAYKIFGFNIYAFKSVGVICYTIFVGIFYIFCVIRLPRIYAIFAALIFAINPYMTNFAANGIVSDIAFMLFGFIALIILAKLFGNNNNKKDIDCFGDLCKSPHDYKKGVDCHENTAYFLAMTGRVDSSLRGSVSEANTTKQSTNKIIDYFNFLRKSRNNKKSINSHFDTLTNHIDCHDLPKASLAMTKKSSSLQDDSILTLSLQDNSPSISSLRGKAEAIHYSNSNGILIAIFGGIFMLFATTIRINGFVILCALLTMHGILLAKRFAPNLFAIKILKPFSLIDSPYSWKIHAIPYIIFAIGFALISITLSSGGGGHFGALAYINIQSILHNLYSYAVRFNQFFELSENDFIILAVCLAPFLLLGIKECLKGSESSANIFYVIFALGFFTLLLLWVETFGSRFVFLLLPFLVFWTAMGLSKTKKIYGYAMSVVLLVILGSFVHLNILDADFKDKMSRNSDMSATQYSNDTLQIWEVIKQNTPKDSIIISFKPRTVYLNTNRLSFAVAKIERLDEADFVLWWADYAKLDIASQAFKAKTKLIFQNAEYKLFKVLK